MTRGSTLTGLSVLSTLLVLLMAMPASGLQLSDQVVATVNGEEILESELEGEANLMAVMTQLQQAPRFAEFLQTSPEGQAFLRAYQMHILDSLIDQKLLQMEAINSGITVSAAEQEAFAQEQIDMIKIQQGIDDDELLAAVGQYYGLQTIEEFKELIIEQESDNLILQKFLDEVVVAEMGITETAAKDFYDAQQIATQGIEFDDIKENIKRYLAQEKYILLLRENADIEILI